jgi:transposase
VRRKFFDLFHANQSPMAQEALHRIGALYAIEDQIRGRPPDERLAMRREHSRPLLDAMKLWFMQSLGSLSQKSAAAKAIQYALSRWDALLGYCNDGRIEIDNNAAERALRCVALGRKNFLFAGSDAGGERAAAMYSLLGTAKMNGYNPEAYLRDVFTRISEHPVSRITELLPWNLQSSLTAKAPTPIATSA